MKHGQLLSSFLLLFFSSIIQSGELTRVVAEGCKSFAQKCCYELPAAGLQESFDKIRPTFCELDKDTGFLKIGLRNRCILFLQRYGPTIFNPTVCLYEYSVNFLRARLIERVAPSHHTQFDFCFDFIFYPVNAALRSNPIVKKLYWDNIQKQHKTIYSLSTIIVNIIRLSSIPVLLNALYVPWLKKCVPGVEWFLSTKPIKGMTDDLSYINLASRLNQYVSKKAHYTH